MGKQVKKKRVLGEGLRRWNFIRSYLSNVNRRTGKKYSGIEINALTRDIQRDYYGSTGLTEDDLRLYIETNVKGFESNALDLPASALSSCIYFMLDDRIVTRMPVGINIVISAGAFGTLEFNTSGYGYKDDRVRDLVEKIRDSLNSTYDDDNGVFNLYVRRYKTPFNLFSVDAPENSYVEMVLVWGGKEVKEIKDYIPSSLVDSRVITPASGEVAKVAIKDKQKYRKTKREVAELKIQERIDKALNEQAKLFKKQLAKEKAKSSALRKQVKANKEMQRQIKDLQAQMKEMQAMLKKIK